MCTTHSQEQFDEIAAGDHERGRAQGRRGRGQGPRGRGAGTCQRGGYKSISWRPYIAGALAGVLAVASVAISTQVLGKPKYLGASTSFVRAAGLVEQAVAPVHVEANDYYQSKKVKVDWQMLLVVGVFVGALGASLVDRSFKVEAVPPIWSDRFGSKVSVRAIGAFAGGVVAMFGARLAGGCPSGHGLSGLMQLSISGYLAMAGFFGAGIIVANLIYRKGGAQ